MHPRRLLSSTTDASEIERRGRMVLASYLGLGSVALATRDALLTDAPGRHRVVDGLHVRQGHRCATGRGQ
eukprot:438837-Heterocapsa_arctica.AAC.1